MVNANLSPEERRIDANHQYIERHKCSDCGESFRTGHQLRNHFGHKHSEVSGSGE